MHNETPTNAEYQAWLQAYNRQMRAWRIESYELQNKAKRLGILTATAMAGFIISLVGMQVGAMVTCICFATLSEFIRFRLNAKSISNDDKRVRASENRRYYDYG